MPNLKKWSGLFSILVTEILNLRDCSQQAFFWGGMDVYGRGWSYAPLQGRQPGGERRSCRGLLQAVAPEERQESFDVA